jgi:hypothetical protein
MVRQTSTALQSTWPPAGHDPRHTEGSIFSRPSLPPHQGQANELTISNLHSHNRRSRVIKKLLCAAALAAALLTAPSAGYASDDKSKTTLVYDHVLPNVPVPHRPRIPILILPLSMRRFSRERSGVRSTMGQ